MKTSQAVKTVQGEILEHISWRGLIYDYDMSDLRLLRQILKNLEEDSIE